jgi:hypothetical protein
MRTAVHEAGHAVAAEYLGLTVETVGLESFQDGRTELAEVVVPDDRIEAEQLHRARGAVAFSGNEAVGLVFGPQVMQEERARTQDHAQEDSQQATRCAKAVLELASENTDSVLDDCRRSAVALLSQHFDVLEQVATLLYDSSTPVDGGAVRELISGSRRHSD